MSKFSSNMLYAFVIYILLYGIVIGYMHITSREAREYCEDLKIGMPLTSIEQTILNKKLSVEPQAIKNSAEKLLFITTKSNKKAICQAYIVDRQLKRKNFVQHIF